MHSASPCEIMQVWHGLSVRRAAGVARILSLRVLCRKVVSIVYLSARKRGVSVLPGECRQGRAVEVVQYDALESFPETDGLAFAVLRAGVWVRFQTRHACQLAFNGAKDVADGVIMRRTGEPVSPLWAAYAFDQPSLSQCGGDLFQILERNPLACGDIPEQGILTVAIPGKVDHEAQGISSTGRDFHRVGSGFTGMAESACRRFFLLYLFPIYMVGNKS